MKPPPSTGVSTTFELVFARETERAARRARLGSGARRFDERDRPRCRSQAGSSSELARGWLVAEGAVWSTAVVVLQPAAQRTPSLLAALERLAVGAFTPHRLDERSALPLVRGRYG